MTENRNHFDSTRNGTKLRVLLLLNDLHTGGAQRQVIALAKGLDKNRYRVVVATLYSDQPLAEELLGEPGIEVAALNRGGKFDFGTLPKLVRFLRHHRIDIIQPFLTPSTFFGLTASLIARTPVRIVTERCGIRLDPHLGFRLYRYVEDRLSRFADAAVPNSEAGRTYLSKRGIENGKIRVIYNGLSSERLAGANEANATEIRAALGIPSSDKVLGIVATLTDPKDHTTFLRAATELSARSKRLHFVIVGDGPLRSELELLADRLGIAPVVHFVGQQTDVGPYLAAMDLAVLSSCDHEGCSNFLIEAMSLRKPVVATDVGGNRELITGPEVGLLVPARDPAALADAAWTILQNPDVAKNMGNLGRLAVERRFTLEKMVSEYERLYVELLESRLPSVERDELAGNDDVVHRDV